MGKTKLDETYIYIYIKSALKFDSFDVAIGIKILFFIVLVTVELGRSLLQFVTTNCSIIWMCKNLHNTDFNNRYQILSHRLILKGF